MRKDLLKKIVVVLSAMIMVFGVTACGGGNDYVTPEMYSELRSSDWANMGQDEMEEFLGVKGVVDEDATANWGEGYKVVEFPGEDADSYMHVLFIENDDGSWRCGSMQPLGKLAEAIE